MIERFPNHIKKDTLVDYFGNIARVGDCRFYDAGPVHNTVLTLVNIQYETQVGMNSVLVPPSFLEPLTEQQREILEHRAITKPARTVIKMRHQGKILDVVFG